MAKKFSRSRMYYSGGDSSTVYSVWGSSEKMGMFYIGWYERLTERMTYYNDASSRVNSDRVANIEEENYWVFTWWDKFRMKFLGVTEEQIIQESERK